METTSHKCVIPDCEGRIVRDRITEVGGLKRPTSYKLEYYCNVCGVMYKKPPKPKPQFTFKREGKGA